MSELERALTAAIKATTEARTRIYQTLDTADHEASAQFEANQTRHAIAPLLREGQLMGYANLLSNLLRDLRRMRTEVRS